MTLPLRFLDSNRSLIGVSRQHGLVRVDVESGIIQPLAGGPVLSEISDQWVSLSHAFSVAPDGSKVSFASEGKVQVWNLLTGELETVLTHTPGMITCAAFSMDGTHLATAGPGSPTRFWKTADWSFEPLGNLIDGEVREIAFSQDGSGLALAGEGGVVIDLPSKKAVLALPRDSYISLALSQDGKFLAAGDERNVIHLWDLAERRPLPELRGHISGVSGLSFAPDGKTLASCGDRSVKLWQVETLQEMLTLTRFAGTALRALFSSDGACLATSLLDDQVQLWHAPSFEEIAAAEAREESEHLPP